MASLRLRKPWCPLLGTEKAPRVLVHDAQPRREAGLAQRPLGERRSRRDPNSRLRLKSQKSPAQIVIKLLINSMYSDTTIGSAKVGETLTGGCLRFREFRFGVWTNVELAGGPWRSETRRLILVQNRYSGI